MIEPAQIGPGQIGDERTAHRHSWPKRALTTVPLFAMTVAWTLVLGDRAEAPPSSLIIPVSAPVQATSDPSLPEAVTAPLTTTPGSLRAAPAVDLSRSASAADIPDAALAAYQRAATVINATDRGCHLPWELLAGIGRVESNHGRFGGSALDAAGVAQPAILGIALDGGSGTTLIADTDRGELDGDTTYDRAVGPMQFIPSTWTYVGVDADGDGVRNPQDIDDAALAAAVYLCVGDQDLKTEAGQRSAVHRYNHSDSYVDLVLKIARAYARGDFTTIPTGTTPTLPTTTQTKPTGPVVPPVPIPTPQPPPSEPTAEQVVPDPPGTPVTSPDATPGTPIPLPSGGIPLPTPGDGSEEPSPTEPSTVPGGSASPSPGGTPDAPPTAAELCTSVGYVDDPDVAEEPYDSCVALLLADPPGTPAPTPAELLARLEDAGIPLPPA